jgi:hypothetical protein
LNFLYSKKAAAKSGKSVEKVEKYWDDAREAARRKGFDDKNPRHFAYATAIVKRRTGYDKKSESTSWAGLLLAQLDEVLL